MLGYLLDYNFEDKRLGSLGGRTSSFDHAASF